ncbi:MAG: site-2 protease family protein [Gemmatimonadota bacterium]
MQVQDLILFLPVLLFSVVLHEYAHGWMARRQGDDTAYMLGRLTLNPIPHIDLFGSIILPVMLIVLRAPFLIGWAKPVPVNPRNYRNYKRGDILVSLAGIVTNIGLAAIATVLLILLIHIGRALPVAAPTIQLLLQMAQQAVLINLVLAFFNLIPIPPLDGSHVLYHLLPPKLGLAYRGLYQYGMLILLLFIFVLRPIFNVLLMPAFVLYDLSMRFVALWT